MRIRSLDGVAYTLNDRPTTEDYEPLPSGLNLDQAVAVRAVDVKPGDLVVAVFSRSNQPGVPIPGPYPAVPHTLPGNPCTGCEECEDAEQLVDAVARLVCLHPSENGEPCVLELRNTPVAVIPAVVVTRHQEGAPKVEYVTLTAVVRLDRTVGDPCERVFADRPDVMFVGHESGVTDTALTLGAAPEGWV
ncbi:hypothetical protein ACFWCA_19135 [Streptomyces phaeochromogenes]|uniref:hypothetical protein n=1 Tax=Streptomyces phaeochromogenes TaxID=1923 RepID=UPI0036B8FED3